MTDQSVELCAAHLLRYVIASADMYYAEMEQRDVFMSCDGQGNFRIWGEIENEGPAAAIDVFEIFLEYAMYCCSWSGVDEALYRMQDFGESLGRAAAKHLEEIIPPFLSENSAVQCLRHIFETANFSVEDADAGVRFVVADYPLENAAKHSGLWNVELAQHGINSMCQSLIQSINPHLTLDASSNARSEFIFTILSPSFA